MRVPITYILSLTFIALFLGLPASTWAEDVERKGDAYVIYLPGHLNYLEVLERLESEILAENWSIVDVQNIDIGLGQHGKLVESKTVSACKSQYLAQAIEEDPYVTLVIPCRFAIFREPVRSEERNYEESPGRLVIGLMDPAAEAERLGLKKYEAAKQASEELKAVLQRIADFYKQPTQ